MHALSTCGEYWGGGGFILVPYDRTTGDASLAFAGIVRAYDPDHIVVLEVSLALWEAWYPGSLEFTGVDSEPERLKLIENAGIGHADPAAERARHQVASWCSPMRMSRLRGESELPAETIRRFRTRGSRRADPGPIAPAAEESRSTSVLAAAGEWRSDLGLLAAMRLGVATSEPAPRGEPSLDSLSWLLQPEGHTAPNDFRWGDATEEEAQSESWFLSGQRLMQVTRGHRFDRSALVVGDTVDDFALALAYDRLLGWGMWLSTALADDEEVLRRRIRPALQMRISQLESQANHLVVTSASASTEYLASFAENIQRSEFDVYFEVEGRPVHVESRDDTVQVRSPELDSGLISYMADEHIGASVSIPSVTDPDGSLEALVGLEAPMPTNLLFPESTGHVPYWYVDVSVTSEATPGGRDIPAAALTVPEGPFPQVTLRASNDGVTFNPRSMGFVPSGALLTSRIGRPRLRTLSMLAWVRAMAQRNGLEVRLSDAGRRAELVRSRLGSRQDLLELVSPANVQMLRAFVRRARRPGREERDPETVVVGIDPYLSFHAIEALLPKLNQEERLDLVDRLVTARLLRRGLVLRCDECARPSFVDVDRLGQQYECPQCGTMNALASPAWRRSGVEPTWFYDLYPNLRELLEGNGDVVLMTAAQLQGASRTYADTPEIEFIDRTSGKPIAEVDIVASVDGEVVVVEAKSNGSFGSGRRGPQSKKLLRVASALRADRIVLATTADEWNSTDVDHFVRVAGDAKPFAVAIDVRTRVGASGNH